MLNDVLFTYLHHLAAFSLMSSLIVEMVLCKPGITTQQIRSLSRYDLAYGISAGTLLLAGFGRLYLGFKSPAFYWSNPIFWTKLALFLVIGLISIIPTLRFYR